MTTTLEGGCLCGEVQYCIAAQPIDSGYCHCHLCQRSSGAPVLAWLTVPISAFVYSKGLPSAFRSSSHSQREFCGNCGTQLAFRRSVSAKTIDITVASLQDPTQVAPKYHIWCQSKISWFEISDSLEQYVDAGPDKHEI